jgi:hypothetical protein
MSEPNNIEGPPPTVAERAAMARELDKVAPTPTQCETCLFRTMLRNDNDRLAERADVLERELAEAREQRDRMAAALEACREDSSELLGERSWWKDEQRADFSEPYDATAENIVRADEALDLIKGGASD